MINQKYTGGKAGLDGHNNDLIAYVRYNQCTIDIFYITEKGNVIYDMLYGKEEQFEFDQ